MEKMKSRNSSIDLFRFLCAIMVVAIHTHPFSEFGEEAAYIFTHIVPRFAVPFFFAIGGYFYCRKLEQGAKPFGAYIKHLFFTYLAWSLVYLGINYILDGRYDPLPEFLRSSLFSFFITGSEYHFWYFPALIFAVCFTTLLFKLKCKKLLIPLAAVLYVIGCISCTYYELGLKIPLLNLLLTNEHFITIRRILLMGFPLFICGYLFYKTKDKLFSALSNKKLLILWAVSAALWIGEISLARLLELDNTVVITVFLYVFIYFTLAVLVNNPLENLQKQAQTGRYLANFTYYSHPLFITVFSVGFNKILGLPISQTPMFLITVAACGIAGFILKKINCRFIDKFIV